VDAVVEQHAVPGPGEAVDEVDAAPLAGRDAGEGLERPHDLTPLELVGCRTLGHVLFLPKRPGLARITESFAWLSSCTEHADDDNDVPSMTRSLRGAAGETFRSFAHRNFRLFFLGQMVSQAGTGMQSVAIVWLVVQLTG